MKNIEEKVKKIIHEQIGIPEERITLDKKLNTDLGIDSLDHIEIIMAFEDEYEFTIDESKIHPNITVGDLIKIVEKEIILNTAKSLIRI